MHFADAGHRGQSSDEEEEGEVEEYEEEVVKKSSEGKDDDNDGGGEVDKAEKQEAAGQVLFAPVTRTVFWSRERNTNR